MIDVDTLAQSILEEEEQARRARARQIAEERIARDQAEQARQEALTALEHRLAALDPTPVDTARQALETALDTLAGAVAQWAADLDAIRQEAYAAGLADVPRVDLVTQSPRFGVRIGRTVRGPQPFQSTVWALTEAVVRRQFGPRYPFGLRADNLPD